MVSEVRLCCCLRLRPTTRALDSAPQSLAQLLVTGTVVRESSNPDVSLRARSANSWNLHGSASGTVHLFRNATLKTVLVPATMQSTVLMISARNCRMISSRGCQNHRPERAVRCAAAQLQRRLPIGPCCTKAAQVDKLATKLLRGVPPVFILPRPGSRTPRGTELVCNLDHAAPALYITGRTAI